MAAMKTTTLAIAGSAAAALVLTIRAGAQSRPAPAPADYGQWESLQTLPGRGGLSPDGRWIAYGINRSNRENELRVVNIADGTTTVAAFGAQPVFSADSRWVGYAIGVSEGQEDKLKKEQKPVHRKLGLVNLQGGTTATVEAIESFAFDAGGTHLAMRRYAPEPEKKPAADGPPPDAEEAAVGATLIVRDLATGTDAAFGNVGEYVWQDKGPLLAITIATTDKAGNGVQLFNPLSGVLRVLDSSSSIYTGLAWRKDAADLAVLRSKAGERRDGPTEAGVAWTHLGDTIEARHVYDPTADSGFPSGMRTVPFRKPSWSEDGRIVFIGMGKWAEGPAPPRKTTSDQADAPSHEQNPSSAAVISAADDDEPAGVDIWHWKDIDVMPRQKVQAKADRERNMLAAWHVESGRFVPIGKTLSEQVTPMKHQPLAYVANWSAYEMERTIGRPAADLSIVDLASGARTSLKAGVDDRHAHVSPGGRFVIFLQDDHYWTIDRVSQTTVNITKTVATSFVDRESDQTIKQKPPFGVAGWTRNDEAVILYDKFDLWQLAPDGSRATRLTNGAADQIRHRLVRLNPDEESIDPEKPQYVSLFGTWTKKSGYGRLRLGVPASNVERLVWLDKSVARLARAKNAEVYSYVVEAFDDSPDVFISGADLQGAKQVTRTNAFADRFAWGRAETIEYKNERGRPLQAALYYPAGYEPGKRYPMIVYMYERLSDNVHRYVPPSEREPYNASAFTSLGYFVLEPDIVFRPREPGLSVADCVGAAVHKAILGGAVDPKRVGIVGHSWGGFDSTFLATHTDLFAAAVAGAPITDLVSNYGNHHWSSGIAETDHIETGQQRMEVPLWEDLPAYIRNSAVFNVQNMKTPLLVEVGDADGTVFWHQGIELYNVARRAKKEVVLLAYAGEDHGLRKKADQLDYHRRIVEWFGHYLKGEPAAPWIADGVPYLDREREVKQLKAKKPQT